MNDLNSPETVKNMRNRTTRMERSGDYWTVEEQEQLEFLFNSGVGITEIALRLQRTEPAVFQQIEKQDLYQRSLYRQRRKSTRKSCACLCNRCELYPECCSYRIVRANQQENV